MKLILNPNVIYTIIVMAIISNTIMILKNEKFNNLYKEQNMQILGIVIGDKKEKSYNNSYKIKVIEANKDKKFKNTYIILNINKKTDISLQYGDKIQIDGEFQKPETERNFGGFDYAKYLKTQNIYGSINSQEVKLIDKNNGNPILTYIHAMKKELQKNISKILNEQCASVLQGILLGDKIRNRRRTSKKF